MTSALHAEVSNTKEDSDVTDTINQLFMSADEINGTESEPVPSIWDSINKLFKSSEEE